MSDTSQLRLTRRREACFADIAEFRLLDGFLARDGRPRPLFEVDLKDGGGFWVPLPEYQVKQIRAILSALAERGVETKISGKLRFATGKWLGSDTYQPPKRKSK